MTLRLTFSLLLTLSLIVSGCGHLDVGPAGDPNRVLTGTVTAGTALPAGAEVTVRILVPASAAPARPAGSDLAIPPGPTAPAPEQPLGEFTQKLAVGTAVMPFRIEYVADDALLRRGLTVEARVSVDGRVRFRTLNAHAISLNSARYPQEIMVQAVAR